MNLSSVAAPREPFVVAIPDAHLLLALSSRAAPLAPAQDNNVNKQKNQAPVAKVVNKGLQDDDQEGEQEPNSHYQLLNESVDPTSVEATTLLAHPSHELARLPLVAYPTCVVSALQNTQTTALQALSAEEHVATQLFTRSPILAHGHEPAASDKSRKAPAAAVNRTGWLPDEDELILGRVSTHGMKWSAIASALPGRTDDAVRNRYLRLVKRADATAADGEAITARGDMWTSEQDVAILNGVALHGFKWTQIASALPGRSANAVRNRYLRGHLARGPNPAAAGEQQRNVRASPPVARSKCTRGSRALVIAVAVPPAPPAAAVSPLAVVQAPADGLEAATLPMMITHSYN